MISIMKNSFDRLINKLDTAKKGINGLENRSLEIIQTEAQKSKKSDVRRKRSDNVAQHFKYLVIHIDG